MTVLTSHLDLHEQIYRSPDRVKETHQLKVKTYPKSFDVVKDVKRLIYM